jgi:hypothetical protein
MILTKNLRNFYQPSIKFPNRKLGSTINITLSPNKVKLTNRAALNSAID